MKSEFPPNLPTKYVTGRISSPRTEASFNEKAPSSDAAQPVACPDCDKPAKFVKHRADLFTCEDQACGMWGSFFTADPEDAPEGPWELSALPGIVVAKKGFLVERCVQGLNNDEECIAVRDVLNRLKRDEKEKEILAELKKAKERDSKKEIDSWQ